MSATRYVYAVEWKRRGVKEDWNVWHDNDLYLMREEAEKAMQFEQERDLASEFRLAVFKRVQTLSNAPEKPPRDKDETGTGAP